MTSHDIDLKGAIRVGLIDVFTALEEAFHDLSDEQIWAFPVPGQNNMAWIIMHCLQNLDDYANDAAGGARALESEDRWDLWLAAPDKYPKPGDDFPTQVEMVDMLIRVREAAMATLDALDEAALMARLMRHPIKKILADFYMRTIYHTIAHTRDLWLLRGALGLADGPWPQQHVS
jgi:hypothetical protein